MSKLIVFYIGEYRGFIETFEVYTEKIMKFCRCLISVFLVEVIQLFEIYILGFSEHIQYNLNPQILFTHSD